MAKDFNVKQFTPAQDWFAILRNGDSKVARVERIIAWVVLDEGADRDDEIGAVIRTGESGIDTTIIGDWFDDLAGYLHASELHLIPSRFDLEIPPAVPSA